MPFAELANSSCPPWKEPLSILTYYLPPGHLDGRSYRDGTSTMCTLPRRSFLFYTNIILSIVAAFQSSNLLSRATMSLSVLYLLSC